MRVGDAVEAMTEAVGVKPCGGCRKAKALLNSDKPGDVLKGLAMIPRNAVAIALGKEGPTMPKPDVNAYFLGAEDIGEYIFRTYPSALTAEQQHAIREHVQALKARNK